ncbi:MAG TPA: hypothetical protein VFJ90_14705 [Candidatus Didemnitutus sp.]|nr:hypothetical protein [Candidatus Didemnitutus sp.]
MNPSSSSPRPGALHVHIDCLEFTGFNASRPELQRFTTAMVRYLEQSLPAGASARGRTPDIILPAGLNADAARRIANAVLARLPPGAVSPPFRGASVPAAATPVSSLHPQPPSLHAQK